MIRWIRVTLPYLEYTVGGFVLVYLLLEGFHWLGYLIATDSASGWWGPAVLQDLFIVITCIVYGAFRGAGFHPLQRADYYDWLRSTPWTSEKALPLGPARLVPQDGAVMFALTLLVLRHGIVHWLAPTVAMLGGCVFCLAFLLALTGPRLAAYAAAFILVSGIHFWWSPEVLMALCTVAYVLCAFGLRRSLRRFPWDENKQVSQYVQNLRGKNRGSGENLLTRRQSMAGFLRNQEIEQVGWPYCRLLPNPPCTELGWTDSILVSLLLGWFVFIAFSTIDALGLDTIPARDRHGASFTLAAIVYIVVVCGAAYRFLLHAIGAGASVPPISILGRLFTLRPIVPGYDKILVAPVLAVVIILLGPYVSSRFGVPIEHSLPCCVTIALLALFRMPPSLRSRELTGTYRALRPSRRDKRFISPSST
ncbi:MAG: hypothetical protein ABH877_03545 [bacterium]